MSRALAHPARVHVVYILSMRVATPAELAAETGTSVERMGYHLDILEEAGFVEPVPGGSPSPRSSQPYRRVKKAIFTEAEWELLPETTRLAIVEMQLKATWKLVGESIDSGAFERRPSRHVSLHEHWVDERGWREAMAVLEETMWKIEEIGARAAERGEKGEEGLALAVSILGFEAE
jgi:DNA-binding transcriptional ArsR family regulator